MEIEIRQYGSDTCAPCAAIRQKLEKWQQDHPEVTYRYLPIEEYLEEAAQKGILSVPTVIVTIDGAETARESGYFSLDELLFRLEQYMKMTEKTEMTIRTATMDDTDKFEHGDVAWNQMRLTF